MANKGMKVGHFNARGCPKGVYRDEKLMPSIRSSKRRRPSRRRSNKRVDLLVNPSTSPPRKATG
jgi:hypothetical protein